MAEKKILKFKYDMSPKNLKIKNLLNQEFLVIEARLISNEYPNRNNSYFTEESIKDAMGTCYNKPVLAAFDPQEDDFLAHESELAYDKEYDNLYYDNSYYKAEVPIGTIRESDKVSMSTDVHTGLKWLSVTSSIWTNYSYRQCKKLLKNSKSKISVEVEVLDSYVDEKGIEVIKKFVLLGYTILSDKCTTGIRNAELSIPELTETSVFQKQAKKLKFAYENLDRSLSGPDNDDPVENEAPREQVSMDDKENMAMEMTYEQKMRKAAEAFHSYLEDEDDESYFYIIDMTDTFIIYDLKGTTYRMEYRFDDDYNIQLSPETAERVMVQWTPYTAKENRMEDFEKKQDMSQDTLPEDAAEEAGIVMLSDEPAKEDQCDEPSKQTQGCDCEDPEKKDEDPDSDEDPDDDEDDKEKECHEEEKCSECGKPLAECECKTKECQEEKCPDCGKPMSECECKETQECKETECKDTHEAECKDTQEAEAECKDTQECKDSQEKECEEKSEPEDGAETEPKETEECKGEECKDSACKDTACKDTKQFVSIGDEQVDFEGLYAKFTALSADYMTATDELEKVKSDYAALKASFEALEAENKDNKNKEFVQFASSLIDSEVRIFAETREAIKENVQERCEKGEFASEDEVRKFTVSTLAMALYEQKGVNENETQKEDFNLNISKNPVVNAAPVKNHSIEKLKKATEDLMKV